MTFLGRTLASCPTCGCLVWSYGRQLLSDPTFGDRRLIRSTLPAGAVERHGFGLAYGVHHECPPAEDCALTPADRARIGREARGDVGDDRAGRSDGEGCAGLGGPREG